MHFIYFKNIFLSAGIVFSDGTHWERQRKFSLQHLKRFGYGRKEMETKIEEEVKDIIESLEEQCSAPVLIHNTFDISSINVLWTMLAGERFALDDERLQKLCDIIHDAFRATDMCGGLLNHLPILRYIAPDWIGYNRTVNTLRRLWAFIEV